MPQYFTKHTAPTKLYIWHITESLEQLESYLTCKKTVEAKKYASVMHQKQYLAKQILLHRYALIKKLDYLASGKPVLTDGQYISISHSGNYVAIAVGSQPVGIDIEKPNPKLIKISSRFKHPDDELPALTEELVQLQYLWTAKESIYKLAGMGGLNFKNNIRILSFEQFNIYGTALLKNRQKIKLFFNKLDDDFLLCVAFFYE